MIRVGDAFDMPSDSCTSLGMLTSRRMRPVLLNNPVSAAAPSSRPAKEVLPQYVETSSNSWKYASPSSPSQDTQFSCALEAPLEDAFSRAQVSYYKDDNKFARLRDGDAGEVPEQYRRCSHVELSISCDSLPSGRGVAYHATIDVGTFDVAWKTEVVKRSSSPSFVARGTLRPFAMTGSQEVARGAMVRLGIWDKRNRLVGTAECRLSDVLWHQVVDCELRNPHDGTLPPTDTPIGVYGLVSVAAEPCSPTRRLINATVALDVLLTKSIRGVRQDARLHYVLLRSAPRGRWAPLHRVDADGRKFKRASIPLACLLQGTLRLCVLRARRAGGYATLAVSQFSLAQLVRAATKHAYLPHMRSARDEAETQVRAEKWLQEDDVSFYARITVVDAADCAPKREIVTFVDLRYPGS